MATIHIESDREDIAKIVLMPGDPKRSEYIAKKFLTDYRLVNTVRGMTAYTGYYKDKLVTVFPSGMGCPSMGIYAYELFKFYNVENVIRIGTCGTNKEDIKLLDIVMSSSSFSLSNILDLFDGYDKNEVEASKKLNDMIRKTSKFLNINVKEGRIITTDIFDPYLDDPKKYISHYPKDLDSLASEMESFALFYMAKKFKRDATCLLTVVDSQFDDRAISSTDREKSLDDMIILALESCLKI